MVAKRVQLINFPSKLVKATALATQRTVLVNSLVLTVTCGIGTAVSIPAQAATFDSFGCDDNSACQSYLEYYGSITGGFYPGSSSTNPLNKDVLYTRVSSPTLFGPGITDGPKLGGSDSFSDKNVDADASNNIDTALTLGQLKGVAEALANATATTYVNPDGSIIAEALANATATTHVNPDGSIEGYAAALALAQIRIAPVPEPSTLLGIMGFGLFAWRVRSGKAKAKLEHK